MRIGVIIQARMGSTRLPGKVAMDVAGRPMLTRVIERAAQAGWPVYVATTERPEDDDVVAIAKAASADAVFRGSTDDVLDRYARAAARLNLDGVVRVTGDCPCIDPGLIRDAVVRWSESRADYVSNVGGAWGRGFDVEVFGRGALELAAETARAPDEREHVTVWMRARLRADTVKSSWPTDLRRIRLCVDEQADLDLVRCVYQHVTWDAPWRHIVECVEAHDLRSINAHVRQKGAA